MSSYHIKYMILCKKSNITRQYPIQLDKLSDMDIKLVMTKLSAFAQFRPTFGTVRRTNGGLHPDDLGSAIAIQSSIFWGVICDRIPPCSCIFPVVYRNRSSFCRLSALRRVLAQHALKGPTVHLEAAGGLRNVALALLEDALDMLPAHAVGRHRVGGRRRQRIVAGEQGMLDGVGVGRLGQVVDGAGLHRGDRR